MQGRLRKQDFHHLKSLFVEEQPRPLPTTNKHAHTGLSISLATKSILAPSIWGAGDRWTFKLLLDVRTTSRSLSLKDMSLVSVLLAASPTQQPPQLHQDPTYRIHLPEKGKWYPNSSGNNTLEDYM